MLNAQEAKQVAQQHFDQWFESANSFIVAYEAVKKIGDFKGAAFQLHQAVERYLSCILLVHTNYRPKTHNIKALYSLACQQADELKAIFPQESKHHHRAFQALKKAYIEARYSEHYEITEEELQWLSERVGELQQATEKLCREKIT